MTKVVRYNEVSLYRGSFPHVLLLMGERKSLVKLRTLYYRVSLYGGSAVSVNNTLSMIRYLTQSYRYSSLCNPKKAPSSIKLI